MHLHSAPTQLEACKPCCILFRRLFRVAMSRGEVLSVNYLVARG